MWFKLVVFVAAVVGWLSWFDDVGDRGYVCRDVGDRGYVCRDVGDRGYVCRDVVSWLIIVVFV